MSPDIEHGPTCWLDVRFLSDASLRWLMAEVRPGLVGAVLYSSKQLATESPPFGVKVGIVLRDGDLPVDLDNRVRLVCAGSDEALRQAKQAGLETARLGVVKDHQSMLQALDVQPWVDHMIVDLHDPTNIPLELLIATFQNRQERATLFKQVQTAEAGMVALGVMEVGTHGLLMQSDCPEEFVRLLRRMEQVPRAAVDLQVAKVVRATRIGMGDRACVDTTSLIDPDEGLLVGSTSSGGVLVCSEVHPLPYMETRPFRFNAGAIHSYVWCARGMTQYLSELKSGSEVLVTSTSGRSRVVTVGRSKIETRPLLLIECEREGILLNIAMQDDWHVRVFGGNGEVRNITTLRVGDELLVHGCQPGRHVGIKISEKIVER